MEYLQMKYHPAKKEIAFQRYQGDHEVKIDSNSRLMRYMKEKGTFVLQDHGNAFLEDIARAFDGQNSVDIQAIMTKLDYEDFAQMVNVYNSQPGNSTICLRPLIELPDMEKTYSEVKKCGEDAIDALGKSLQTLYRIEMKGSIVKQSADNFVSKTNREIQNIKDKIKGLSDNRVNLCFAGVYSAGKSALINAILGYRILPESIKSETAKMFRIFSPKPGENVKICFKIRDIPSEIEWSEPNGCFVFSMGPAENEIRTRIQETVRQVKESGDRQHEQIYGILKYLNQCDTDEISSEVTIKFPVPLDSKKVRFAIYDTPGTDSNYEEHKKILDEALKVQSHSILIFVAKPDGLEGEGNNILLDYLKAAEENDGRTCIDLSRSLFVINKADTQTLEARKTLQEQTIKSKTDDRLSIKLSDKKLFFVSAVYGYAAKAVENGITTEVDEDYYDEAGNKLRRGSETKFFFYRQNRCATSEYSTQRMQEKCDEALDEAKNAEDETTAIFVASGLYALEREIVQYGEKYAAAVKAYAIIDSIDRALTRLQSEVKALRKGNQEEITAIDDNIRQLKSTMEAAIDKAYQSRRTSPDRVPREVRKALHIEQETGYREILEPVRDELDKILHKQFLGKVAVKEEDKGKIRSMVDKTFLSFTARYLLARQKVLEQQRDSFMDEVKQAIAKNGKISDSAKEYFLEIPKPSIDALKLTVNLDEMIDSHKYSKKVFLFFNRKYLDKEGFVKEMDEVIAHEVEKMQSDYCKDYCTSLNTLAEQIRKDFNERLSSYSLTMQGLLEDRVAMGKIGDRMESAATEVDSCLNQLNKIIWKVKKDV